MAHSVEPQTAEPRDRLLAVPDPPPRAGQTPPSDIVRSTGPGRPITTTGEPQENTGVQDPELEELADTGDYIPLSS